MPVFNLFQRPCRMVFLDDDQLFLDVLRLALPSHWHGDLFSNAKSCIDFLQLNSVLQKVDGWRQQDLRKQSLAGESLIPLVLKYWNKQPDRYELVETAVFDYAMPGMNGLEALERLINWDGRRALLTGQADHAVAVAAFNAGTIQQFIPKQTTDLRVNLHAQLQPLLDNSLAHHQALWRQGLSPAQLDWLSEPAVCAGLRQWLASKDCVEYVVTDAPFGVLMANRAGKVSWLQLESKMHLADVVELASEDMPECDMATVLSGKALPNVELSLALGGLPLKLSPAFAVGKTLLGVGYDLGEKYDLAPDSSYGAWCTKHAGSANFRVWGGGSISI